MDVGDVLGVAMMASLARLLALLAFVLMPMGMSSAPAAGSSHAMQMAGMSGCDEHPAPPQDEARHGMDCAAACSMMVPQVTALDDPVALHPLPADWPAIAAVLGLHPEAATPPPRRA